MEKYDLIVIGSGPAGEKAAIQAAKLEGGYKSNRAVWLGESVSIRNASIKNAPGNGSISGGAEAEICLWGGLQS